MVTTSSLIGDLNFKVSSLDPAQFEEDAEIVNRVKATLDKLVETLKPIMKYIDQEVFGTKRGVEVAKEGDWKLYLDRDGNFFEATNSQAGTSTDPWKTFEVQDILEGLRDALTNATAKRKEHLAAVEAKKDLLDKMIAITQEGKPQS